MTIFKFPEFSFILSLIFSYQDMMDMLMSFLFEEHSLAVIVGGIFILIGHVNSLVRNAIFFRIRAKKQSTIASKGPGYKLSLNPCVF